MAWLKVLFGGLVVTLVLRPLRRAAFGSGRATFVLPAFLGGVVGCLVAELALGQMHYRPAWMGWLVPAGMLTGALVIGERVYRWARSLDQ